MFTSVFVCVRESVFVSAHAHTWTGTIMHAYTSILQTKMHVLQGIKYFDDDVSDVQRQYTRKESQGQPVSDR
jgi:hypothetical protein